MLDRSRSRDRSKTGDPFSPVGLFVTGAQGAWYDPSDFSTLYQDSTGTTPVTAVEQPVGLLLDRSRGLVLGANIRNGTVQTSGSPAQTATYNSTTGAAFIYRDDGSNLSVVRIDGLTANVAIEIVITVAVAVSGVIVRTGSPNGSSIGTFSNSTGTQSRLIIPQASSVFLSLSGDLGLGQSFTLESVRELPGTHAFQATSASRPVLRATNRLDFDGVDDRIAAAAGGGGTTGMLFVAGINLDAVGAASTIWSDTGTNTGYRVRINASNQVEVSAGNGAAYTTAATSETLASGTNYVIAAWHDGTNLNARLGLSGAIAQAAFATATAGTAAFTLGMDNGATSSFLNGKLYNAVYVRNFAGTLSDVNATAAYVSGTMA